MLRFFVREKFSILLAVSLLNVIVTPFLPRAVSFEFSLDLTFTAVMFFAVFAISKGKKTPLVASVVLMLPCLVFIWWTYFYSFHARVQLVSTILQALFVVYMAWIIFMNILHSPRVNRDVISAAVVVYLFVALFFSKLYLILELTYPGSFSVAHDVLIKDPSILRYFSMVTISTLGYGDILPISSQARTIASVEALVGQIYLAVLIARLVSMHGVESFRNGKKSKKKL